MFVHGLKNYVETMREYFMDNVNKIYQNFREVIQA